MKLEIAEKVVYGAIMLYPKNETAQIFAKLLKKKTFYHEDLNLIKSLGHEVEIFKLWL